MPIKIAWLVLAAVHLMPALAFFRPVTLGTLYGIAPDNPLFLLIHHRAALFVAVCVACVWAAFDADARRLASVVTAISMLDLAGLPFLAFAAYSAFRPA
jgi:hypothetical protein